MKYTRSEAERLFKILAKRMGKTIGYKAGEWHLDNTPHYGGWAIEEYEKSGGVLRPFSYNRLTTREFCKALDFAIGVLDYQREQSQ